MPVKKTKANNDKYQSTMKAFYGAIKRNNELIQKLLEVGLSLESIDVLFGLKKLDFDREFHEANPDLNLQYSVGKGVGSGGGIDLPLLTPDQLENIFSAITGTPRVQDTRSFNAFLGHLQTRANFINDKVNAIERVARSQVIDLDYNDTQFNNAFIDLIATFAGTPGVLNIHLPSTRGPDNPEDPERKITQPARYYGDIDQVYSSLGEYLADQNQFKRFIKEINQKYNLGLNETDGVQNAISRVRQYYDNNPNNNVEFRTFLQNFMGNTGSIVPLITDLRTKILNKGNPEDKKKLIIAIVNIICHGDDLIRQNFIRVLNSQVNETPSSALSSAIAQMLNLGEIKKIAGESKGQQKKYGSAVALDVMSEKLKFIIGLVKNYLQTLGYVFDNASSYPPSELTKPEGQRNVDLATQKTPNEQLEAKAGEVFDRVIENIRQRGEYDDNTLTIIISIIQKIYSALQQNYSTADADKAYTDILKIYDQVQIAIRDRSKSEPTSTNESSQVIIRNLWGRFLNGISSNAGFIVEIGKLLLTGNPTSIRNIVNNVLDQFRISQSAPIPTIETPQQIPQQIPQTPQITSTSNLPAETQPDYVTTGTTSVSLATPEDIANKYTSEEIRNQIRQNSEQKSLNDGFQYHESENAQLINQGIAEIDRMLSILEKQRAERKARSEISDRKYEEYKQITTRINRIQQQQANDEELLRLADERKQEMIRQQQERTRTREENKQQRVQSDINDINRIIQEVSDEELLRLAQADRDLSDVNNENNIVEYKEPSPWPRNFRLTRQYIYTARDGGTRMFHSFESALASANQEYKQDDENKNNVDRASRVITRYGLYYTVAPRGGPEIDIQNRFPRRGRGGGGDGGGGDPNDPNSYVYTPGDRFRGLDVKTWIRLLAVIVVLASGIVTIDDLIKSEQDINKDGTTSPPGDDGKNPPTPSVPTKPPSTGGSGTPGEDFFPDKYSKINHSELWDSIGLGSVIDTYNAYVDEYNEARQNKSLTKADLKIMNKRINDYYGKFAAATNTPTLPELVKAKSIYDNLRKEYDSASEKGLSFSNIIMLYKNLRDAANHVDELTSKYLDIENGIFGTAKSKDDADITIDDDDYANISAKMTTSLGGKSKLMKPAQSILSKGMIERISRKLNNQASFTNEELNDFNSFGMVKDYNYPNGLGSIENNPLIRRNKEYEIQQYLKCNPNPKPYIVPSKNKLEQYADADGTKYFHEIQNTDGVYENPFYVAKNKKVTLSNPYDNAGDQFNKSILFNPPINPKVKNVETGSNMIRSGPYYGVNKDPCYQYGNIEYKYNEKLNKYPLTNIEPMVKPTRQYKIASKVVKKSRVPDSYSLK